jgi:hypothetical protein
MESLMISASREDAVRTYAENFGIWPIKGPVEREEADGRVHALDCTPQIFTVLAKMVVSGTSISLSSGSTRKSLTYQQ